MAHCISNLAHIVKRKKKKKEGEKRKRNLGML